MVKATVSKAARWFRQHVRQFTNLYVLVGGVACLGVGLWQVYPPASWIGVGVIAIALVVLPGVRRNDDST